MFERYLTDVLTTHFGHVLEGLDSRQVRLSAWNGEVVMHNVRLKRDALDHFLGNRSSPVEIAHGVVGNLEVRIPWKLVRSHLYYSSKSDGSSNQQQQLACSVILTDVNILVTPKRRKRRNNAQQHQDGIADGKVIELEEDKKDKSSSIHEWVEKENAAQALLDKQLLQRVAAFADEEHQKLQPQRWQWIQDRLASLVSNLSVTIRNIHIRYEDPGTSMGFDWKPREPLLDSGGRHRRRHQQRYRPAFAIGVTLRQFSIQSGCSDPEAPEQKDQQINKQPQRQSSRHNDKEEGATVSSVHSRSTLTSTNHTMQSSLRQSSPKRRASRATDKAKKALSSPYFKVQHKIAAAEELAVYWDSDCPIMCNYRSHCDETETSKTSESLYYEAAFQLLNGITREDQKIRQTDSPLASDFPARHCFLLEPFSPSAELALVRVTSDPNRKNKTETHVPGGRPPPSATGRFHEQAVPPSAMDVSLPGCHLTISRNLLEDIAYLRRCFSVWIQLQHKTTGQVLISEADLQRLAKLRPVQSPLRDAGSWWKYAFEVVKIVRRIGDKEHGVEADHDAHDSVPRSRRRRGWLGLTNALSSRRRYVGLYRKLLSNSEDSTEQDQDQLDAHNALLNMEKELLVGEIVAFRIAAYGILQEQDCDDDSSCSSRLSNKLQCGNPGTDTQQASTFKGRRKVIAKVSSSCKDDEVVDSLKSLNESEDSTLSLEHRLRMFTEMARALDQENSNAVAFRASADTFQHQEPSPASPGALPQRQHDADDLNTVTWETSLTCPDFSLQVNDRSISAEASKHGYLDPATPVVRLSCALIPEQLLFKDGSWEQSISIEKIVVKDCTTATAIYTASDSTVFPNLVSHRATQTDLNNDGIRIRIRRTQNDDCAQHPLERGSTTITEVRVVPLEIVYKTTPCEALSRIFENTATSPELVDDYQKIATKLIKWKDRQQRRLLSALAHKQKKIIVDVDVGAPVFLIPEESRGDSPLLVVDLGRLQVRNASEQQLSTKADSPHFDYHWRLELTSIQVQCSSTYNYRISSTTGISAVGLREIQQVVEPFSLSFAVSTNFRSDDQVSEDAALVGTSAQILATLPRLAFNLTSSAVRLLRRLQNQWDERRGLQQQRQRQSFTSLRRSSQEIVPAELSGTEMSSTVASPSSAGIENSTVGRRIEFKFMAPLLTFKFENDVDGRDCKATATTPLVDIALRGTEGNVLHEVSMSGNTKLTWSAKLRALDAVDLYQAAGDDYAFLMSSVSPELISGRTECDVRNHDTNEPGTDLVTFAYSSTVMSSAAVPKEQFLVHESQPSEGGDRLLIQFHELYVEWNPETLAAINKAMKLPKEIKDDRIKESASCDDDDDVFFDAVEDDFYDPEADDSNNSHMISEISSSPQSSASDLVQVAESPSREQLSTPAGIRQIPISRLLLPLPGVLVPSPHCEIGANSIDASPKQSRPSSPQRKPFELVFELSKLRINCNKDSRHRRLITAEMDSTGVRYTTSPKGGSKTKASIGNLTFTDSESAGNNKTLYREILGLKTDETAPLGTQSSLLEMEIIVNPRSRSYSGTTSNETADIEEGVHIDETEGKASGFDYFLRAQFSPMRFVYLQQLWFEVVDYFFEGILGDEVWGNERPQHAPVPDGGIELADKVTFTLFECSMEAPVILFPVTYCSTDYIRLEAGSITLTNHYDIDSVRVSARDLNERASTKQWYNNCDISIEHLKLLSWSGRELSQQEDSVRVRVTLNWPTGPTASLNVPKWKVDGSFDALHVSLQREDYALLQHVIQHNISEESRHLDEWNALQSLPPLVVERYKQDVMVHFGYDKKDVAPTTFIMCMRLPVLYFTFNKDEHNKLATVECSGIVWKYKKVCDLVSRQQVSCDVRITGNGTGEEQVHMFSSRKTLLGADSVPDLFYTSTTQPSGDNEKTLDISDACIDVVYPLWRQLSMFFQALPNPTYLSPSEVIQVGDRWYKIGHRNAKREVSRPRLAWISGHDSRSSPTIVAKSQRINPTFVFRLSLSRPRLVLSSGGSSLVISLKGCDFVHTGNTRLIDRHFSLNDITLFTTCSGRETSCGLPWTISGSLNRCNGRLPCECKSHSFRLAADELRARAAFSDLAIAMEVCLRLFQDMKTFDSSISSSPDEPDNEPAPESQTPEENLFGAHWQGIQLVVVDDSGRHFSSSQELVVLSIGCVDFFRNEKRANAIPDSWRNLRHDIVNHTEYSMKLGITSIDLIDCLQSEKSPFRAILSIRPAPLWEDAEQVYSAGKNTSVADESFGDSNEFDATASDDGGEPLYAIELSSTLVNSARTCQAMIRSVLLQYNPSLVIALQRFLGRLSKEARMKAEKVLREPPIKQTKPSKQASLQTTELEGEMVVKASVDLDCFTLCLNKEHQGRRLLESSISGFHLGAERNEWSLAVAGHAREISVRDVETSEGDLVLEENRNVLRTAPGQTERFIVFSYGSFSKQLPPENIQRGRFPGWVMDRVDKAKPEIDDYLDVSVSALETVFLRERTEELADYLSNGMPGKSMGATTRAAQGFVRERIHTKSFLRIHVDSPKVLIPRHEAADCGLSLRLGDLSLQSWTMANGRLDNLARKLSLSLSGLCCSVYRGGERDISNAQMLSNLDLLIEASETESLLSVSSKLSDVHVCLRYSDYVMVTCILKENILRMADKRNWDNLEVAWEAETSAEVVTQFGQQKYSKDVSYASTARYIRYGRPKGAPPAVQKTNVDVKLSFSGLSVLLSRDDPFDDPSGQDTAFSYDLILSKGYGFDASLSIGCDGDLSLGIALERIFVFDLGQRGRMLRERHGVMAGQNRPGAYSVMVEGYSPPEKKSRRHLHGKPDSQLVIRFDRSVGPPTGPPKTETNVSLVINYLSITALVRPLQEVMGFFSCSWPVAAPTGPGPLIRAISLDVSAGAASDGAGETLIGSPRRPSTLSDDARTQGSPQSRFHVRFVLHYPRFISVADEGDPHSRALILRGLAIVNATVTKGFVSEEGAQCDKETDIIEVNADFQKLESRIHPDRDSLGGEQHRHEQLAGVVPSDDTLNTHGDQDLRPQNDELGVPLLLPLTVGIEFEQGGNDHSPTKRTLAVHMDPLSMRVSYEDVQVIEAVVRKWSSRAAKQNGTRQYMYDVVFHTERLGLGLRREANDIVVDNIADALHHESIDTDDAVYAINGDVITKEDKVMLLSDVVDRLASEPRPLTITFSRSMDVPKNEIAPSTLAAEVANQGSIDDVDFSLSSALVILMDKEVPLVRGMLSATELNAHIQRTTDTLVRLNFSSTIGIEYYNLRIWGWEPLLEPGGVFLSAEFQDRQEGPKELALEVGDRLKGPLCLNVTDASAEILSRIQGWGFTDEEDFNVNALYQNPSPDPDRESNKEKRLVSRKTANAALQFAQRQRHDTAKPFVFRNRTGVSVAFARQKPHNAKVLRGRGSSFVGDYNLHGYDSSEITVVANGEESIFRVDVAPDTLGVQSTAERRDSWGGRFPFLTVALQAVAGVTVQPLVELQISRPEEALLPLTFLKDDDKSDAKPNKHCVTWLVDQADEKTVLTLGSAVRVVPLSMTHHFELSIEIGVEDDDVFDERKVKPIGTARLGSPFYLPLWLGFQQSGWRCCIKPAGEFLFSPLFQSKSDGTVYFGSTAGRYIECLATNAEMPSVWLAASQQQDHAGVVTVTIDCCLSICNLLPTSIEWEVADCTSPASEVLDGSTTRGKYLDQGGESSLDSGGCAEAFVDGTCPLKLHFRGKSDFRWSTWASLCVPAWRGLRNDDEVDDGDIADERSRSVNVKLRDVFGVPLTLGVRISQKDCSIDVPSYYVTLYAELWLRNCTPLPVSFGCPKEQVVGWRDEDELDNMSSPEFSAAEAALKEISSLFDEGTGLHDSSRVVDSSDIMVLPAQAGTVITEECFEYIEVESSTVKRRWWASEDPGSERGDVMDIEEDGSFQWLDRSWKIDYTGATADGWETSPSFADFTGRREFSSAHRYRRRRWFRTRHAGAGSLVDGINAFHQPVRLSPSKRSREGKPERAIARVAIQVDGGKWALTSKIPSHGTAYGAVRATGARWPNARKTPGETKPANVYELCYAISPLDGNWGELSRLFLLAPRFLLRNDSNHVVFEVKQSGAADGSALSIPPGETAPFHWADFHLPELVCIRPVVKTEGQSVYRWSGGFDPLTIGAVPLRIRKAKEASQTSLSSMSTLWRIRSLKMEADIRPGTGGTGINLSFQEEDEKGDGALFRVENMSIFPIWLSQDGVLANPSRDARDAHEMEGELLEPSQRLCYGLDVPFRQGKYAGRKAATMSELLRLRLGLAPLSSRAGIETTKVISLATVGDRVRLNPSKLLVLKPDIRMLLQRVRIVAIVSNDGPTRVLKLSLMEKGASDNVFGNPFGEEAPSPAYGFTGQIRPIFIPRIVDAALETTNLRSKAALPTEEEAVKMAILNTSAHPVEVIRSPTSKSQQSVKQARDFIISIRAEFSGILISLVDDAPSEIAVLTLRNVNALATFNTLRTSDSTVYVTVTDFQVDNMVPNAPFPVAVCADDSRDLSASEDSDAGGPPLLVIGLSFAPRHQSGIVCLRSVTVAPRNIAVRVDLAFLVRLQKFVLDIEGHFQEFRKQWEDSLAVPDIHGKVSELEAAGASDVGRQKFFFGGLTILPCNIKLSVAPARALTPSQAILEGEAAAAIHHAVRKGDVKIYGTGTLLGVKVGHRNSTPLAVVRGVFKSIVVDALLRLDGASLNFAGVSLRNHISTGSQLGTHIGAHYMASLRQNVPALLGSLAAFGNPLGLVRGLGDGVSDLILEPVKGFQRSVQEMDATFLIDGVARGTVSLARHTVGGLADSASMLTETFSKNMTVLTLDRRYAQKRDRGETLRNQGDINVALGLGSGVQKLVTGFLEGVTGVVKAPIRGAEKRGIEGFAKGIGKGLLGLLVKPIIGISDGITDVMIGVKGSVDGATGLQGLQRRQIRPRRPLYGRDRVISAYNFADAAAAALMLQTRLAGEFYLSHVDMGDRVALFSIKRLLLLGTRGEELLVLKFKHIENLELRSIEQADGTPGWGIVVVLNTPRRNGSEVEVISCRERAQATDLCSHIENGMRQIANELSLNQGQRLKLQG